MKLGKLLETQENNERHTNENADSDHGTCRPPISPRKIPFSQICSDFWYNSSMVFRSHRGQAMLEYILATAALLVVVTVMSCLVRATRNSVYRTERLVSSDYP